MKDPAETLGEIVARSRKAFEQAMGGLDPFTAHKYETGMAVYLREPLGPIKKDMERLNRLIAGKSPGMSVNFAAQSLLDQVANAPLQAAYKLRRDMSDLARQVGVPRVRRFGK